jgi:hypothetical protein
MKISKADVRGILLKHMSYQHRVEGVLADNEPAEPFSVCQYHNSEAHCDAPSPLPDSQSPRALHRRQRRSSGGLVGYWPRTIVVGQKKDGWQSRNSVCRLAAKARSPQMASAVFETCTAD